MPEKCATFTMKHLKLTHTHTHTPTLHKYLTPKRSSHGLTKSWMMQHHSPAKNQADGRDRSGFWSRAAATAFPWDLKEVEADCSSWAVNWFNSWRTIDLMRRRIPLCSTWRGGPVQTFRKTSNTKALTVGDFSVEESPQRRRGTLFILFFFLPSSGLFETLF